MIEGIAALLLGVLASGWDIRTRRVPNGLTLGFPAAAMVVHVATLGTPGVLSTAAGWAVGLVLFLPLFALGGDGGGGRQAASGVRGLAWSLETPSRQRWPPA